MDFPNPCSEKHIVCFTNINYHLREIVICFLTIYFYTKSKTKFFSFAQNSISYLSNIWTNCFSKTLELKLESIGKTASNAFWLINFIVSLISSFKIFNVFVNAVHLLFILIFKSIDFFKTLVLSFRLTSIVSKVIFLSFFFHGKDTLPL